MTTILSKKNIGVGLNKGVSSRTMIILSDDYTSLFENKTFSVRERARL